MKIEWSFFRSPKGFLLIFLTVSFTAIICAVFFLVKNVSDKKNDMEAQMYLDVLSAIGDSKKMNHLSKAEGAAAQAEVALAQGDIDRADELFDQGVSELGAGFGDKAPIVCVMIGQQATFEGDNARWKKMEELERRVISNLPKTGSLTLVYSRNQLGLARALIFQEKYAEAMKILDENLNLAKQMDDESHTSEQEETAYSLNWLAYACERAGDKKRSIEIYEKLISILKNQKNKKDLLVAYLAQADAMSTMADLAPALAVFKKAADLDPQNGETYAMRGRVYCRRHLYPQAINDLTKTLSLAPNYAFALSWRSMAYRLSNKIDLAVLDADKIIKLTPEDAAGYEQRALAHEQNNQVSAAMEDWKAAVDKCEYIDDSIKLARLLVKNGRFKEAVEQYTLMLAHYGEQPLAKVEDIGFSPPVLDADDKLPSAAAVHRLRSDSYRAAGMPGKADKDLKEAEQLEHPTKAAIIAK